MQATINGETIRLIFKHIRTPQQVKAGKGGITMAALYRIDENGKAHEYRGANNEHNAYTTAQDKDGSPVQFCYETGRRKALKNLLFGSYSPHSFRPSERNPTLAAFSRDHRRTVWNMYWTVTNQAGQVHEAKAATAKETLCVAAA